jgi:hypothetical protein
MLVDQCVIMRSHQKCRKEEAHRNEIGSVVVRYKEGLVIYCMARYVKVEQDVFTVLSVFRGHLQTPAE